MDRRQLILKYVTKNQRGIEIGPWFNPIAPKREGYRCLVLDVFDAATLRQRATADPNVDKSMVPLIEEVDFVGSSTSIGDLVQGMGQAGTFDYIVSSHNFEHLPDPIRFLQGCGQALKPDGMLSMAIPDRRACFDYFRPVTRLSEWIQSFVEKRERPSPSQNFDTREVFAHIDENGRESFAFFRNSSTQRVSARLDLDHVYGDWMTRLQSRDETYHDSHCSVFTPASFELLMRDVAFLNLAPFEVLEVFDSGCEFHAHLRKTDRQEVLRPADYEVTRNALLRKIHDEAAETSGQFQAMRAERDSLEAERKSLASQIAALTDSGESYAREIALAQANAQIAQDKARIAQLEDTVHGLRSSTSWRATAPIRRGIVMLRSLTSVRR